MGIEEIWESITEGFSDLFDIQWSNSEVFTSPKFWIPIAMAGGILFWVLKQWEGKVSGLIGYYFIGGLAIVAFGYFWAARDLDKNG